MSDPAFDSLDALSRRLPFHLDDIRAVNACYLRLLSRGDEQDRLLIEIWTYCFIRRYFIIRFLQEPPYNPADFDEIVDGTYEKVERFAPQLQHPKRFANWVSVICKNSYLNYVRRRRRSISIESEVEPGFVSEPPASYRDAVRSRIVILRAIGRLPAHLQECVRLKILEGLTYEEIGAETGQPLPRIRAYINKAMKRLREDFELMALLQGDE